MTPANNTTNPEQGKFRNEAPTISAGKFSGVCTIDHAAELRGAIAQTRLVFEGYGHVEQALDYLQLVLASNLAKSVAASLTELRDEMAKAASAPQRDNTVLAQLKRELFTAADQLQQPADLTVQMLLLAELRGLRTGQVRAEKLAPTGSNYLASVSPPQEGCCGK
jgi:hypothetical protein